MRTTSILFAACCLLGASVPSAAAQQSADPAFGRIAGVRELSDGRVLITDSQARSLFVLDATLKSRRKIGRDGDGPGEYRAPGRVIALEGDRSIVIDNNNRKWYLLDGDRFLATPDAWRNTALQWNGALSGISSTGAALDGRAHGAPIRLPFPLMPRLRDSVAFVRLNPNAARDTIGYGRLHANGAAVKRDKSGLPHNALHPLNTADQAWLFPDGTIAIARVEPYRVEWREANGRVVNNAPVIGTAQQVTTPIKQWVMRHNLLDVNGDPIFTVQDYPTWPRTVPAFTNFALVAGTDGRLYIRRTQVSDQAMVDVFDRQRGRIASVTLPPRSRLVAVGTRGWYLAQTNDDEEELLVRWTPPTTPNQKPDTHN